MNLRQKAISERKVTYSSGRPCRKGHLSERYTSNGMCIQCLKDHAHHQSITNRESRIIRNTSLINGQSERKFMLTGDQYNTVLEYTNLLINASPEIIAQCTAFIHGMHSYHHTLNKYALSELLDFRDNEVHNVDEFDIYEEGTAVPYIKLNNNWYDATVVMQVLRGLKPSVSPTQPELFNREIDPE